MSSVEYPAGLDFSTWERGTAAAKTKPPGLADSLKQLRKLYDEIDFKSFDTSKLKSVDDAKKCGGDIDEAFVKRIRPIEIQAKSVTSAADKWISELKKTRPEPKPAIAATEAASRGAEALVSSLKSLTTTTRSQLAKRQAELESAEDDKDEEDDDPKMSQHKTRLRTKVIEMFRIVKNRPDREVNFVVCVGNKDCMPYLGPIVGPTQKTLLKTVMKGNSGLKYYYGRCVYEESAYTFVGLNVPSSLRKRLERSLLDLTGSAWRVRVRSGQIKDADEEESEE